MKKILATLALLLAGCATRAPVIDTKGVDMGKYTEDLQECQYFASPYGAGSSAAAGAGAGALFGALLGAAIGGRSAVGLGARIGAVEGLGGGAVAGVAKQTQIVNNCMMGRGYRVLG